MSSTDYIYLRQGQFLVKDGDVEFNFQTYDGIGLPQFPAAKAPGGYQKRINDIINLDTRPDDVLLATYPKCGSNWGNEILNMLLQGNTDYTRETKFNTMLEAIGDLSLIDSSPSPRVLNVHLPYKWFPRKHIENSGKIIHITRNPKDTYVSFYHYMLNLLELGVNTKDMTWKQFFDTSVMEKGTIYGSWFDYEKEMHQAKRNNKNIHTVHFEKLKEEPEKEIKGIAVFLNLEVSDHFIKDIAHKCQFQNLKKAKDAAQLVSPQLQKFLAERKKKSPDFKPPDIYRKGDAYSSWAPGFTLISGVRFFSYGGGIVGDWKNHFTVAQNEQFDACLVHVANLFVLK